MYNKNANIELVLDRGGDRMEFARVKKRLKEAKGKPIVVANQKPIPESIRNEVKYRYGYVAEMAANVIDAILFAKNDQEGNIFVLIKSSIDTRTDGTQTLQQDVFGITNSGTTIRKNTTKVWKV